MPPIIQVLDTDFPANSTDADRAEVRALAEYLNGRLAAGADPEKIGDLINIVLCQHERVCGNAMRTLHRCLETAALAASPAYGLDMAFVPMLAEAGACEKPSYTREEAEAVRAAVLMAQSTMDIVGIDARRSAWAHAAATVELLAIHAVAEAADYKDAVTLYRGHVAALAIWMALLAKEMVFAKTAARHCPQTVSGQEVRPC